MTYVYGVGPMKVRSLLFRAIIGVILVPATLFAHHNFRAEFDSDQPIKVTGTVTKVEWTNPHARFYVNVEDDTGEIVNWDFELASPNILFRRGWKRDSLKPGDVVTVTALRARNSPYVANTGTVTLGDGQRVFSTLISPRE